MSRFSRIIPFLPGPLAVAAAAAALALGACSSAQPKFQDDQLLSSAPSPFSRNFAYASTDACEGARRALLSQGYMTTMTHNDTVDATKNFQPASDSHIVVEVHVVCTAGDASNTSMVYVNAVQNGYALKKSDTSASVGLSILGSVSLPIRSNSDEMVKISSETIQSSGFYERFFDLIGRYLSTVVRSEPVPGAGSIKITPLPPSAEPVTAEVGVPVSTPAVAPASVVALHPATAAAVPVATMGQAAQPAVVQTGAATGVALPAPVAPVATSNAAAAATAAASAAAATASVPTTPAASASASTEPPLLASGSGAAAPAATAHANSTQQAAATASTGTPAATTPTAP